MSDRALENGPVIDVAVIGAGPSGLAAATALKAAGVKRVVVLEREAEAGGIPRHCGHPPFGMREFGRVLRGPAYARRLVRRALAAGVEIHLATTVVAVLPGTALDLACPSGRAKITARRIIYATGVRETPRAQRLISGARAQGILNTGALQSMVYLKNCRPFQRPVIIGSELVAFSAIMTCRHAGIRPQAMIESQENVIARWPSRLFAPLTGVRLLTGTRLGGIIAKDGAVIGVDVTGPSGQVERISCDGVILCGEFTPESSLARLGHLAIDPATGGPVVDQWGRCSDPSYFATGNVMRPVETAGWCWREGGRTGAWVAADLAGTLPERQGTISILPADPRLDYVLPQTLATNGPGHGPAQGMDALQLRVTRPLSGVLTVTGGGKPLWRRRMTMRTGRRILVPVSAIGQAKAGEIIRLEVRD